MFQGRWNSNTDDQGTGGSGYGSISNDGATSHQPAANANTTAQMTQGDMLSQLVANLQSQQQQQQAKAQQVQAALVRAFGPCSSNSGVDFSSGGNGIGGGTYDFNSNMLNTNHNNTIQGLNGMSDMNGNNSGIMSSFFSSGQQSNISARELLSRMQMPQQQTQQQQQHQQQDGLSSGMSGSNNSSSSSNNNSNATADELIKLQLEQEIHNRLIQLAQQDRQGRAILANQDSMMKKARWGDIGENNTNSSATTNHVGADGTTTSLGENSNNNSHFAQFPRGVPTGFTNNIVGNGMNVAQQFGKLSSLVESLQNKQQGMGGMGGMGGGGLVGMNNNTLVGRMNTASAALLNPGIASLLAGAAQNLGLVDASSTMMPSLGADLTQRRSHNQATIVPCRARGLPVDHNFKTAYFVIPDGIEHGDELMCSYPACRQAGVKFRYCLECKVPVAKRNFRNRHRHGVSGKDGGEEYSSEEGEESEGVDDATATDEHRRCLLPEVGNGDHHRSCHSVPPLGSADGTTTSHREDQDDRNDNDDYAGVKKEHIIIIPGAAAPPLPMIDAGGMKKKRKGANIRVPCRARGMPMAHNFKTAYFMIPSTIEHGDELLCSFPSCRSAGAKFRYCLHCKLPVAKRNFRNRHKHGNMGGTTDKAKNGGNLKSPKEDNVDPLEDGASPSVARNDDDSKLPLLESAGANANNEAVTAGLSNQSVISAAGPRVCVASSQDATKVQRWVELLDSKPDPEDKDAMAVWMANLMNASSGGSGIAPTSAAPREDNVGSCMDMLTAASDQVEGGSSINEDEVKLASAIDEENEEEDNLKREREEGDEEEEGGRHIRTRR